MGGDGGTTATMRKYILKPHEKTEKIDNEELKRAQFSTCSLSGKLLQDPVEL